MTERRYDEAEAAEIFRRATETQEGAARQLPSGEGMTLSELQDIGKQVGVPPELLADAARALARREPRFQRKLLGLTVGVGRTVGLDHRLSDEEWERLVVVLRETFDARGNMRVDGSLRQWTNGNLQVLVEPSDDGDRLRMRTVHAMARRLMLMGIAFVSVSAVISAIAAAAGLPNPGERIVDVVPFALTGTAFFGIGLVRLRGWAATRLAQMDQIAARVTAPRSHPDEPKKLSEP